VSHFYVAEQSDGTTESYVDKKRWWWMLSLLNPLIPILGIAGHFITSHEVWLLLPLVLMFVLGPFFDWLLRHVRHCLRSLPLVQADG